MLISSSDTLSADTYYVRHCKKKYDADGTYRILFSIGVSRHYRTPPAMILILYSYSFCLAHIHAFSHTSTQVGIDVTISN